MNAVSKDIRDRLVTLGLAPTNATQAWFISVNLEPMTPKNVIAVFDLPAPGALYYLDKTKPPALNNGFQIRVRGIGQTAAWNKLEGLRAVVAVWRQFSQGGMKYRNVQQDGDIFLLKHTEADDVWVFAVNFLTWRVV